MKNKPARQKRGFFTLVTLLLLSALFLTVVPGSARSVKAAEEETIRVKISGEDWEVTALWEDNAFTRALTEEMPMTLSMTDGEISFHYNGELPEEEVSELNCQAGDMIFCPKEESLVILPEDPERKIEGLYLGSLEEDAEVPEEAGDVLIKLCEEEVDSMKMQVTDGKHTIVFELNDSSPARSLYDQLPLSLKVENYSNDEKIFYPARLDTSDPVDADAKKGTLAYFSPWGDVVMYYRDFGSYSGLYELGEAISGKNDIQHLKGTIEITAAE